MNHLNKLKEIIQNKISENNADNQYQSGYKQCLIDIQNEIDVMLNEEKNSIIEQAKELYKTENLSREQLIEICQDAVVHHTKWQNRDSYSAQIGIQSIYKGLTAGLDFRIETKEIDPEYCSDEDTLIIEFIQPIDHEKLETGKHLEISSREDYFRDCDPEYIGEMFNSDGIDFKSNFTQTYMPTRKRLNDVGNGNDWY